MERGRTQSQSGTGLLNLEVSATTPTAATVPLCSVSVAGHCPSSTVLTVWDTLLK